MTSKLLKSLLIFACLPLFAPLANAQIEKVFSTNATGLQLATDSTGDFVYVPDQLGNQLLVISARSLSQLAAIPLPGAPNDVALDETDQLAYVTVSGWNQIFVIDLLTNLFLDPIAIPYEGYEIAVAGNQIFVTTATQSGGIMRVDRTTGQYVSAFTGGLSTYTRGAIELTPDRSKLIFANRGLSPASTGVFEVTPSEPQLLIKNDFNTLGSNGQALAVDLLDGQFFSYATGAYPRAIHYSIDGTSVYTNNQADEVKVWDSVTTLQTGTIAVLGNTKDFIDLLGGSLIAMISDQEFAIYRVRAVELEPVVSVSVRGAGVYDALCVNQTTHQRVSITLTGNYFDCVAAGLTVTSGDIVRVQLRATVD
ncbi:hypothetical protein [Halioxenophilus sp. WMMB6]|uniref:YncE family protein n=1 Tax=Halioxenophilus sp. WMMB6 TaxID=3073815 RepID=UPI00295E408B|nr:hypothetical protein [Halioxenophilus sp. WMMB6]